MSKRKKKNSEGFNASAGTNMVPERKIELKDDNDANKGQQAVALINQGKLYEAEVIYREMISAGTANHITYTNLAAILGMQGKKKGLIDLLKTALNIQPNFPEAHYNLGLALNEQGDIMGAIKSCNRAISLKCNFPEAFNTLGVALHKHGDLINSVRSYRQALTLNPNYSEAFNNLGVVLDELDESGAAIDAFKQALSLNPNFPDGHNNLGAALQREGDLLGCIAFYEKAIALKPDFPQAFNNLGTALKQQGNIAAAIDCFNHAIALRPNYLDAHWNASLALLLGGDYKNGWEKYECRINREEQTTKPHASPQCSFWNGDSLPLQSHLLLVSEQGLGDTLQFMRYAITLKAQGFNVSLCAETKLHSLIQASGIDPSPLSPSQANEVKEGVWMPLLSLPRYLEVSQSNPILNEPYIKTSDQLIGKWKAIFMVEHKPVIGINWQGNKDIEKTGLFGRSLPLEAFAPIAKNSSISLVSMQKGFGSEQLKDCSFKERFSSCQEQINDTWDFLETAAIIANCDLIITSDTSVAHLAGGMGKSTWLLLHHVPDWRWGLEGDASFWYPSMRLFRQEERGNWHDVMQRIADLLREKFPD